MKYCIKCGREIAEKSKYCPKCGYPVSVKSKKKSKRRIKVFLLVTILFVTGAIAYNYNNKKRIDYAEDHSAFYVVDDITLYANNEEESICVANDIKFQIGLTQKDSFQSGKITEFENNKYYKLQHYYKGIPVWGETLVLETNTDGTIKSLISNNSVISDLNVTPTLSEEELKNKIVKEMNNSTYRVINKDLAIYCNDLEKPVLVYDFFVSNGEFLCREILIDAQNGKIVKDIELINSIQTKTTLLGWEEAYNISIEKDNEGYSLKSGNIETQIADVKRIGRYNAVWDVHGKTGIPASLVKVKKLDKFPVNSVDAYANVVNAIEYYSRFCLGLREKKCTIVTGFQYLLCMDENGKVYEEDYRKNAFHQDSDDEYLLAFGYDSKDNRSSAQEFDVVAHELGHQIFSQQVVGNGATYEQSAINEAFADIFAVCAENKCREDGNWIMGGKVTGERNIQDPSGNQITDYNQFINKDQYEHQNSTILSHVAYNIWNNSSDLKDYDLFMELWYRALQYIQSNSTMSDCEKAVYNAAKIMIAEEKISHSNRKIIENAFEKAGIHADLDRTILVYIDSKADFLNVEEGYYCLEELSAQGELFGNVSVINDYQGVSHAEVIIDAGDKRIFKEFKWNKVRNVYEVVDGTKEFEFNFLKEDEQLFGLLKDIESQREWKFALKKYNYLNGINITLAVRKYFWNKKDGIQYTFDTCDFQKLYIEQYIIPVYQVKDEKVEKLYVVLVAGLEFEESGEASVFLPEDINSVIAGEKTFLDIRPLEEFNVYSYFPFE